MPNHNEEKIENGRTLNWCKIHQRWESPEIRATENKRTFEITLTDQTGREV